MPLRWPRASLRLAFRPRLLKLGVQVSETVPRSKRPSFRLLPFFPPRFPLPITSTRTPSKFASEIKPSAFKRTPAARVLTFKFSVTVSAVPERSSTTSDASSVIPSSSTRGTSPWAPVSAQPFDAAPPDAFPTPTGGTAPPPWPRKSTTPGAQDCVGGVVKKKARVPSSFSYEAELSKHRHRIVCFERLYSYSRLRSSCRPGKLVSHHEHAVSRPPTGNLRKNESLTSDAWESSESRKLRIGASPPREAVESLCRAVSALISQTPLTEGSQGPPRTTFGQPRRTSRVPRQANGEQR